MARAEAQRLTRSYTAASLSDVLVDLNKSQTDKRISFIYDELEDFTVTTSFHNSTIGEAVREVVGFYPMKITTTDSLITVECIQKETMKVIGRVVDAQGTPIEFANISLYSTVAKAVDDSQSVPSTHILQAGAAETADAFINGGVSNENGDFVIPCKEHHRPRREIQCRGECRD